MKTHAILLAGGSSARFTDEENKVYFPVGRKPALCWPLETLEKSEYVDSILLVVREEDWEKTNIVIELVETNKLIGITAGGKTRHESEYEGLMYLKNSGNVSENDLILIHDGARPLLPMYLLDELIEVAKRNGASAPGFNSKTRFFKFCEQVALAAFIKTSESFGLLPSTIKIFKPIFKIIHLTSIPSVNTCCKVGKLPLCA